MATHLLRKRSERTEQLVLLTDNYCVKITIEVRGLEFAASDLELALHAPLSLLAGRLRETI